MQRSDRHKCATCGKGFGSKNSLHNHLRQKQHQVIDDRDIAPGLVSDISDEDLDTVSKSNDAKVKRPLDTARQRRRAVLHHYVGVSVTGGDQKGSVTESPPGTEDGRCPARVQDQDAQGRVAGVLKPTKDLSTMSKGHPGQKVKRDDVTTRDQTWCDIGSGIFSRTFIGATRLHTTSRGGPNMCDIQHRKIWNLTSGKVLDECYVDDVSDKWLHRELERPEDIRVEVTLRNAMEMFEKKGPDVVEIFSQPRICQEASNRRYDGMELNPGYSLDLTMNDSKTGEPWDLSKPSVQARVLRLVRDTQPHFVIGSPPCTPFSPLQEISRAKRDPKVMADEYQKGMDLIRFCIKVYSLQLEGKRHFIHEHPATSTAWKSKDMVEFMMKYEVDVTTIHMCAYGMTSSDDMGEGLVKKPTTLMSSSPEVLKRVAARCSNETEGEQHRHVHLVQGRAKRAQVYPRKLGVRICMGIAAQRKLDRLGMRPIPIISVEEMQKAMPEMQKGECPSETLHETDGEGYVAWDDVSGQELSPSLMRAARREEIAYFKSMGVYEKVDISESWKETGKAPIAVRWVDINKGDFKEPKYRSRLVAKEFNTGVCPELYAATPPSECLRLMLSLLASGKKNGTGLMYADASRAYLYAKAVRPVYVNLPEEDIEPGDEDKCGRLKMSMYGTLQEKGSLTNKFKIPNWNYNELTGCKNKSCKASTPGDISDSPTTAGGEGA